MTPPAGRPPGRKTYTRLAAGRRVPPEYELVSTDLHYNHPMRFELTAGNPVVAWYYRYREGSPLQARNWEQFSDPRRTTYRGYTQLQDGREDVVDGLLREVGCWPPMSRSWRPLPKSPIAPRSRQPTSCAAHCAWTAALLRH